MIIYGRIVLPMEIRRIMEINTKDSMEIFIDGSSIILKKYKPNCIFCGNTRELLLFDDKLICNKCREKISKLQ